MTREKEEREICVPDREIRSRKRYAPERDKSKTFKTDRCHTHLANPAEHQDGNALLERLRSVDLIDDLIHALPLVSEPALKCIKSYEEVVGGPQKGLEVVPALAGDDGDDLVVGRRHRPQVLGRNDWLLGVVPRVHEPLWVEVARDLDRPCA